MENNQNKPIFKEGISDLIRRLKSYSLSEKTKFVFDGVVIVVFIVFMYKNNQKISALNHSKCKTKGEIVSKKGSYRIRYKYTVDGKEYINKDYTKMSPGGYDVKVSNLYYVYYDCNNPESSVINYDEIYIDSTFIPSKAQ